MLVVLRMCRPSGIEISGLDQGRGRGGLCQHFGFKQSLRIVESIDDRTFK